MQNLVREAHTLLIRKKKTIAVAESCTGGHLCSLLTREAGSSAFFSFGAVTYSNEAKNKILHIPRATIHRHGAVSREVALMMARNVRRIAKTDIGIGITGIAGPAGGTARKPVGTVYIAVSFGARTIYKKHLFHGSRTAIRSQSARAALALLLNAAL